MNVEFWGVRGTFPSPGKDKTAYGGHTPCASIAASSEGIIIVDAGTGIKDLGDSLVKGSPGTPLNIILFLTHFHLDHVMGFPFFAPLFSSDSELTIYAPARSEETEKYLRGLISGRYFPLELFETRARKIYRELPPEGLTIDGTTIRHCPLRHPQGAVSYRFEEGEKSIVFATDTEHPREGIDERLAAFAQGATILVYDATFTPEEYEAGRQGWGHSTWLEGTRLARAAGVGELLLSHWNPDHADMQVDRLNAAAREIFPRTTAARQRLRIDMT